MIKLILFLQLSSQAFGVATGRGQEAQSLLIEKFSRIYLQLPANDSSKTAITLRLADLLSERARLDSMLESEKGCDTCNAGAADRAQAIKYYLEILPKLEQEQRAKVLTQLGHLYELTGKTVEAQKLYEKTIQENVSGSLVAEAELSLGEIYFKERAFDKAVVHYDKVLTNEKAKSKSLAAYRKAWSLFNMGQTEQGEAMLITILKSSQLLTKVQQGLLAEDTEYKSEVARDLATFMAKNSPNLDKAKILYDLTPEAERLDNLAYLAGELVNLSMHKQASEIYQFVIDREPDPKKRMNYFVVRAQAAKNLNSIAEALQLFSKSVDLWQQTGCKGSNCDEIKTRMRNFILTWNKEETKAPSTELIAAYDIYIGAFKEEGDAVLWQAETIKVKKDWQLALAKIDHLIEICNAKVNTAKVPSIEDLLLTEVAWVEESKNDALIETYYKKYLSESKVLSKKTEVEYQLAQFYYSKDKYNEAALGFYKVANEASKSSKDLNLKAADLALDSLALLKDNARLEAWSTEFTQKFPTRNKEYSKIHRSSLMNQAVAFASAGKAGDKTADKNLAAAWLAMEKISVDEIQNSGNTEDLAKYYRNKEVLAEKLNKLSDAKMAAEALLALKTLSAEDRNFALERKSALSELTLDFKSALSAVSQLNGKDLTPGQKHLKMALFADLAGEDSSPYYRQYLQSNSNDPQAVYVAIKLLENSADPDSVWKTYHKMMLKDPEEAASKYLQGSVKALGFARFMQTKAKGFIAKGTGFENTSAAKLVKRSMFLTDLSALNAQIAAHKIESGDQKLLNKSLKERMKLLALLEAKLAEAVNFADWATQVASVHSLSVESKRFFEDLSSLPMPEGLNDQEQMEYMNVLSQQSTPYKVRSEDMALKEQEFWSSKDVVAEYKKSYDSSNAQLKEFLAFEIKTVAELAKTSSAKPEVAQQLVLIANQEAVQARTPASKDLNMAREDVIKNPYNLEALKKLMSIEDQMGRSEMVAYLKGRIDRQSQQEETQQ